MGHQDQDRKKLEKYHFLFKKSEAATAREKQKFIHFQASTLSKNTQFRAYGAHMGHQDQDGEKVGQMSHFF